MEESKTEHISRLALDLPIVAKNADISCPVNDSLVWEFTFLSYVLLSLFVQIWFRETPPMFFIIRNMFAALLCKLKTAWWLQLSSFYFRVLNIGLNIGLKMLQIIIPFMSLP